MEPDDSHVDFRYINNVSKNEKIRKIHNADTFTIFVPILISHFGLPLAVWDHLLQNIVMVNHFMMACGIYVCGISS